VEYNATAALGELPRRLAASQASTNDVHGTTIMNRHALTIAMVRSQADRPLVALLGALFGLLGCSRSQAIEGDVPSGEQAWVNAACTPASPDIGQWARRLVGGVMVSAPPGYTILQGPPTNVLFQGPARRSQGAFSVVRPHEAQQNYDSYFFRQRRYRNACRANLSGYTADVIATYDAGRYTLYARWDANQWGGEDSGKWLEATILSPRLEEAIELRAILHTVRPAASP
jgi:hypothetical protein